MRNMRYKYLFVILSVVLLTTLENLYSQNTINTYAIRVGKNDIAVDQLVNGFQIYIKKKPNVYGFRLLINLPNGNSSYLYINNSGENNAIVNIKNTDYHAVLGDVFQIYIPNTLYLDNRNNNAVFRLRNNIKIVLESYDVNFNTLLDNEITFKINNTIKSAPTITLRNVEKEGDLYAFYLYYSGGDNGEYAFYVREGKTNTAYKLIKTSFVNVNNYDNSGIILEDTFSRKFGKKLYVKAYFKQLPEDRYLSFNVFNTDGESFTYPIDYVIETANFKKDIISPEMPSGGKEGNVRIRQIDRVIETSTNTFIVGQNNNADKDDNIKKVSYLRNPIKKYYNGEAIDSLHNASISFNTPDNFADGADKLSDKIRNIIDRYKSNSSIDLVIVLDTTESMHPYLRSIKRDIRGIARDLFDNHRNSRVGFLLYRDVKDKYFTKMIDFNDDINVINKEVNYFYASGGGDKPEPMYEAIQEALEKFNYISEKKLIIVITDAPPKIIGRADLELNSATSKAKDITVELVLTSEVVEEKDDNSDDNLYFLNF